MTISGRGDPAAGAVFDGLAAGYDAGFSHTALGCLLRRAVWRRLEASFRAGDRVLELGCGTGEDALHLARQGVRVVATDASPAMLAIARRKADDAGVAARVATRRLAIEELAAAEWREAGGDRPPFDGAWSNFGALNCIGDLAAAGRALAGLLRPGAPLLLCVMGPLVPWEWAWFLSRRQPAKAFRRLAPGGVRWRGQTVRYPSIRALSRAFAPAFRRRRVSAVGALLPPTYAEDWAARHPRLIARLARWEQRLQRCPPLPWLADHYLLELERR